MREGFENRFWKINFIKRYQKKFLFCKQAFMVAIFFSNFSSILRLGSLFTIIVKYTLIIDSSQVNLCSGDLILQEV